jgi:hypothetical protein
MKFGVLAICLLSAFTANAKAANALVVDNTTITNKSCPIWIQSFGAVFSTQRSALGNFEVRFKNQSDKVVIGVTFGIEIMDSVGDFHSTIRGVDFSGKMNPTKGAHISGNIYEYFQLKGYPGERLHLNKVAFGDGSVWSDDGTGICHVAYDYRKT